MYISYFKIILIMLKVLNSDHIQEFCWQESIIAADPDLDQKFNGFGFRSEKSMNPDPDQKITWIEKLHRS